MDTVLSVVLLFFFLAAKFSLYMHACEFRGCLHDTGVTFALEQVHSGSLSWLYNCLHDTTTKCHASASHSGVSSRSSCTRARISLWYEISYHLFRCEIGLPVDWNWLHMRNVCEFEPHVYLINMKCTFKYQDMK